MTATITNIDVLRKQKDMAENSVRFTVMRLSENSADDKLVLDNVFYIPNLVIVLYSPTKDENIKTAEKDIASLGFKDSDKEIGIAPILLDALTLFQGAHGDERVYELRHQFIPTINKGLEEMGDPYRIPEDSMVQVTARYLYIQHYNRKEVLEAEPCFNKHKRAANEAA